MKNFAFTASCALALVGAVVSPPPAPSAAAAPLAAPLAVSEEKRSDAALRAEAAAAIARDDVSAEDAEVRRAALAALAGEAGTLVAVDPRSGRVLAVVNQEWAVRRAFNPASTLKTLIALAGITEGVLDPAERIASPDRGGSLDLTRALATSSSDYFQVVGERLGREVFTRYARRAGFGEPTGIALAGETAGRLPTAEHFAKNVHFAAAQGLEATPIQLAMYAAALANGGKLLAPRYGADAAAAPVVRGELGASEAAMRAVLDGMVETVRDGTGQKASAAGVPVAGKTGTNMSATGFFISFAPVEAPRVASVVVLRGSKANGFEAARVAGEFYRALGGRL